MDVVVQEVAKARDELRRGRLGVVGAEDGVEAGVRVQARAQEAQRVGVDLDVRVDEDDDVAAAAGDAGVARGGRAAARRAS